MLFQHSEGSSSNKVELIFIFNHYSVWRKQTVRIQVKDFSTIQEVLFFICKSSYRISKCNIFKVFRTFFSFKNSVIPDMFNGLVMTDKMSPKIFYCLVIIYTCSVSRVWEIFSFHFLLKVLTWRKWIFLPVHLTVFFSG